MAATSRYIDYNYQVLCLYSETIWLYIRSVFDEVNTKKRQNRLVASYVGVNAGFYSLVLSFSELTSMFLPLIGPLSDYFGHTKAITIALFTSGIGVILVGFGKMALPCKMIR